jgi:hypothetical protein
MTVRGASTTSVTPPTTRSEAFQTDGLPGMIANFLISSSHLLNAGNTIHETWVNGRRFMHSDPDVPKLQGTYALNLASENWSLEITEGGEAMVRRDQEKAERLKAQAADIKAARERQREEQAINERAGSQVAAHGAVRQQNEIAQPIVWSIGQTSDCILQRGVVIAIAALGFLAPHPRSHAFVAVGQVVVEVVTIHGEEVAALVAADLRRKRCLSPEYSDFGTNRREEATLLRVRQPVQQQQKTCNATVVRVRREARNERTNAEVDVRLRIIARHVVAARKQNNHRALIVVILRQHRHIPKFSLGVNLQTDLLAADLGNFRRIVGTTIQLNALKTRS